MAFKTLRDGTLRSLSDLSILTRLIDNKPPTVFLTGDGHRHPAFSWTAKMQDYFEDLADQGLLCAFVETFPSDVAGKHIPNYLAKVHAQNRLFGWEPPLFKDIGTLLEQIQAVRLSASDTGTAASVLLPSVQQVVNGMVMIDQKLKSVNNAASLMHLAEQAHFKLGIWQKMLHQPTLIEKLGGANALSEKDRGGVYKQIADFFKTCYDKYMNARFDIHPTVAMTILKRMLENPRASHLIAVGGAHITVETNPIQQYLDIGDRYGVIEVHP